MIDKKTYDNYYKTLVDIKDGKISIQEYEVASRLRQIERDFFMYALVTDHYPVTKGLVKYFFNEVGHKSFDHEKFLTEISKLPKDIVRDFKLESIGIEDDKRESI